MINKKRGYKSSRKAKSNDESGQLIDGMEVAKNFMMIILLQGSMLYRFYERARIIYLIFTVLTLLLNLTRYGTFSDSFIRMC